jgi:hypothetical protein
VKQKISSVDNISHVIVSNNTLTKLALNLNTFLSFYELFICVRIDTGERAVFLMVN